MSEHCIKIIIPVSGDFGTEAQRANISGLGAALDAVLSTAQVGEYDGDEYGGGEATLYLYGADADKLFETIQPLLAEADLPAQTKALLRYGAPNDPAAKTKTIEWG